MTILEARREIWARWQTLYQNYGRDETNEHFLPNQDAVARLYQQGIITLHEATDLCERIWYASMK